MKGDNIMYTFFPLWEYIFYLTPEQLNATHALMGYLLELAVKDFFGLQLVISKPGSNDLWRVPIHGALRVVEAKENGGDFRHYGLGNSFIFYAVFIDPSKDLRGQLGYLIPMRTFRTAGDDLHHIRHDKKDRKGNSKVSLQGLYNYKQGDYHGVKAFKLIDRWTEDIETETFKEFFQI